MMDILLFFLCFFFFFVAIRMGRPMSSSVITYIVTSCLLFLFFIYIFHYVIGSSKYLQTYVLLILLFHILYYLIDSGIFFYIAYYYNRYNVTSLGIVLYFLIFLVNLCIFMLTRDFVIQYYAYLIIEDADELIIVCNEELNNISDCSLDTNIRLLEYYLESIDDVIARFNNPFYRFIMENASSELKTKCILMRLDCLSIKVELLRAIDKYNNK